MEAKRAVAYTRYSSDNQREESIDAQMRAIQEYCSRRGYVLVENFSDEARSATTDNRPSFKRMIEDSKRHSFDVVVVHKLDRFARDRYDSANYRRILKQNGVNLESVLEHLDGSPESIILESVLEGMAEYYSKNLARETRKGLLENAMKGRHVGGRPPYGYKINPETLALEIDERSAPAVRLYFENLANGLPLSKIVTQLNSLGYRTYTGRPFTKNSFWDWAQNLKYIGIYTWDVTQAKKTDGSRNSARRPLEEQVQVEGRVPAIISKDLWEKVQSVIQGRKHKPGLSKAHIVYLLSDKIRCGSCQSSFRGSSYLRRGQRYSYYKCTGNCGNKQIEKSKLENAVIARLVELCFTDHAMEKIVRKVEELYLTEYQRSNESEDVVRKELAEVNQKLTRWIDAIGEGLVEPTVLKERIAETTMRKQALEYELERLDVMNQANGFPRDAALTIMHQKKNQLLTVDETDQKLICQQYVDSVVVRYDEEIQDHRVELTVRLLTGVESGT